MNTKTTPANSLPTPEARNVLDTEPFQFFFPLVERQALSTGIKTTEIGNLKVQGEAVLYLNALGEYCLHVDLKWVKYGVDIKPVLIHFGKLQEIEEEALRYARRTVFNQYNIQP